MKKGRDKMRCRETATVGLALYLFGAESTEEDIRKLIELVDENGFITYQFDNRDLQMIVGHIKKCMIERVAIPVDDFMKCEHIIGILKKMCNQRKKMLQ